MLTLLVKAMTLPQQVDDFPEDCERSCKGSLHIKPGTLLATAAEWAHIQESRPDLASCIVDATPPVSPSPRAALAPDPDPDPETETETETLVPGSEPPASTEPKLKKRTRRGGFVPDAD